MLFVECKNHAAYIHGNWQRDRRERGREGRRGEDGKERGGGERLIK